MSSRPTTPLTASAAPAVALGDAAESRDQRVLDQRARFRTRHARALTDLMGQRDDLRGVHALADLVDDAVRGTA
ncbi:hypothetical protein [Nocardioides sp. AX2bis]|uniref:hypothetical protein n=1 Tax=Nocardioides sp. AX2bis TaxID=2653157 RepID=UPI0012F1BC5B|nr:hypothetical protein [Nocardioides sp. AX2bis]VXB15510.1 conserved hypothetical protein [Nocardioides sp. AX2bis]